MSEQVKGSQSRRSPAIWHPVVDFLCVGGASIIGGIAMIFWFSAHPEWVLEFDRHSGAESVRRLDDVYLFWVLTLLINYPHFMASYRILYRSKKQVQTYRWSAVWIPLILAVLCCSAVVLSESPTATGAAARAELARIGLGSWSYTSIVFGVMAGVNVVYLGWHYNMQSWGMTASFAQIHGISFTENERWAIKSGFFAMVLTHAVLYLIWSPIIQNKWTLDLLLSMASLLPVFGGMALLYGAMGFRDAFKRTGKRIPVNAITPWLAAFFWYFLVARYHNLFGIAVAIQIAHALQYLSFTTRVERNLLAPQSNKSAAGKLILTMAGLTLCGWLVFIVPMQLAEGGEFGLRYLLAIKFLVIAINTHHFFVDGAIWKISNPEVRRTLFAHLTAH
jgi:hypothetical protein